MALNESDNIRERQQRQQQPVPLVPPPVQIPQPQQLQVPHQIINQQQQQQQQQHQLQQQQQQQYQFPQVTQFAAQVLPVPGPSQVSTHVGGSGSALDTSLIGQSTPRPSLGDFSFSSVLRGATDALSPGDFLNTPSVDDTDTHHS